MKTRDIERRRLGEQVAEALTRRILAGDFPPGMHLSEINICTEMGVSRTPVREAFFKLEEKGLVISHPNRGFFVPPLNKETVRENYPILASLDALALKTSPPFSKGEIGELKRTNGAIKKARDEPLKLYQLDLDFHRLLTEKCPNKRLLALAEGLKFETRQRDGGYKRGLAARELAYREHMEIISLLEKGDNKKAAEALENHWLGGIKTVTKWIDRQQKTEETRARKKTA